MNKAHLSHIVVEAESVVLNSVIAAILRAQKDIT